MTGSYKEQLQRANQLHAALGHALEDLSDDELAIGNEPGALVPSDRIAQRMLRLRRRREAMFGSDLFNDPSWDILLSLFVAEAAGEQVSIRALYASTPVPHTTALRWLNVLEERGLIVREQSPADRRVVLVSIGTGAKAKIQQLLEAI